jgi:hypothetical protein
VDAVINIVIGGLLLLTIPFPEEITQILGVPAVVQAFYPSLFGAVLFGIGIALLLESRRGHQSQWVGLGLGGAIAINCCAGIVLTGWLLFGALGLPTHGKILLWGIVIVLFMVSGIEYLTHRTNQ